MKFIWLVLLFISTITATLPVNAQENPQTPVGEVSELNPFDPNVEQHLKEFDKAYELQTGEAPYIEGLFDELAVMRSCYRASCRVWARISKASQRLQLYINGQLMDSWAVSTGKSGFRTPNFDRHPNGRIYNRYTSRAYPEGDYNGLGNMPYAVFIQGGFAMHGTPEGNWSRLGRPASHGCIRQLPSNALRFNRLVRMHGIRNVWITVE